MAEYFVKNLGNDSADGLSDANAWESIAKINGTTFAAGDILNWKRGSRFFDATLAGLNLSLIGASGNPIIFRAYGSDIRFEALLAPWTSMGGGVWRKPYGYQPESVWDGGVEFQAVASVALMVAGSWYWDHRNQFLHIRTFASDDPSARSIEVQLIRPPIISGGPELVDWVATGGHWRHDLTITPVYVVEDEWRYLASVGSEGALTPGTYFYDGVADQLYVRLFGDDDPAGHVLDAPMQDYPMRPSACQHVRIEDIEFRAGVQSGWLGPPNMTDLAMYRVVGRANRAYGIYFAYSDVVGEAWSNVYAEDCRAHYNGATGIGWGNYYDDVHLVRPIATHNCHKPETNWTGGIRTAPSSGINNVIENWYAAFNGTVGTPAEDGGHGLWLDSCGIGCEARDGHGHANWRWGLNIEAVAGTNEANGCQVTGNIVTKNGAGTNGGGLTVRTNSNYCLAANNTVYDNVSSNLQAVNGQHHVRLIGNIAVRGPDNPAARCLDFRHFIGDPNPDVTVDRNCFGPEATGFIIHAATVGNDVAYDTYADFEAVVGPINSVEADPQLIDPENGDFRLRLSSPCRDRGLDVGLPFRGMAPDIGVEELPPALAAGATGLGV